MQTRKCLQQQQHAHRTTRIQKSQRHHHKKGHYELDLSLPIHRFAAARLRDQAHSEPAPEGAATWLNLVLDDFSG